VRDSERGSRLEKELESERKADRHGPTVLYMGSALFSFRNITNGHAIIINKENTGLPPVGKYG
jgi:hypothetical protein